MLRYPYDALAALVLLVTAFYALRSWRASAGEPARFSLVAGLGTLYLAFDEFVSLHEHLGHALYADLGWREPPGINHFDDLIVMCTGLAGLVVIAFFREEVLRIPRFAAIFTGGLLVFASAIAWDAAVDPTKTYSWWTEETMELSGALLMAAAFGLRWLQSAIPAGVAPEPTRSLGSAGLPVNSD